jgi:hypothetical protein
MAPVQPEASVVQTGLGIKYIGDWIYAFSGDIVDGASGSAATPMLDFTTGSGVIIGQIGFTEEGIANDNVFFKVNINGVTVINVAYDTAPTYTNVVYPITIPPFSDVLIKWGCSGTETGTAWLTGRVYGVK